MTNLMLSVTREVPGTPREVPGTPYLIPRPSLGAGFLPSQDPAQILLQRRQKGLVAQRAPSVLVGAKEFQVLLPDHPGEKATPVRGQLEQGSNLHQCLVPPAHMCPALLQG